MALSEAAVRHHEELFPGRVSPLQQTDPELIEYFDNFAFDEVLQHGDLDIRTRLMVQLAAMIAAQAVDEYKVMAGAALTIGVTPVEMKEIVYQAVPYVGMAKVIDFLHATNDVLTERGVELPLPGQSTTTPQTRLEKGRAVQSEIVGHKAVDAMYAAAPPDLLHIQRYLSANCFGDHLTRTGLDLSIRELITFSLLVTLGGCDPQVKGHVRGNLNVGNDRTRLIDGVTQLLPGRPGRCRCAAGPGADEAVGCVQARARRPSTPVTSELGEHVTNEKSKVHIGVHPSFRTAGGGACREGARLVGERGHEHGRAITQRPDLAELDPVRQRPGEPSPQPHAQPTARLQLALELCHRVRAPSIRLDRELVDREIRLAEDEVGSSRVGVLVVFEPALGQGAADPQHSHPARDVRGGLHGGRDVR